MKYLITGGCGFLGSNIAAEILKNGADLVLFDSLYRYGSSQNLEWLNNQGEFQFIHGDIRNANDVERIIRSEKPDVIFHLAGQVAMTTSIADPRMDFEVNAGGSFNLLNAVRLYSPESVVIYSSTNKVYGDLEQYRYKETKLRYECVEKPNGFDELVNLDFHSPYGASKGSADQYMLDFARIYGIRTAVFRHSSMFGGRQFSTVDQGWVGWFTQIAVALRNNPQEEGFSIAGNGKQVRDLLYASDCVSLYLEAAINIDAIAGEAYNIGGGIENSCSLLELFDILETECEVEMRYEKLPPRESDQRVFVAETSKIRSRLDWKPSIDKITGIRNAIEWINNN